MTETFPEPSEDSPRFALSRKQVAVLVAILAAIELVVVINLFG